MHRLLLLLSFVMIPSIFAQNLGVYGSIYPIAEPDLLAFIHNRLNRFQKDGQLHAMQKRFVEKVKGQALRPRPVSDVQNALKNKIFYDTPKFSLKQNIYDANGKLQFSAGTTVNPLDEKTIKKIAPNTYVPQFNETLLFINADDVNQVQWAQSQIAKLKNTHHIFKVILVKGNLKTTSSALGRIYFDQDGVICHQLNIHSVPALVTRSGNRLKIQIIALGSL